MADRLHEMWSAIPVGSGCCRSTGSECGWLANFEPPPEPQVLEIPAGKVDLAGSDPLLAAKRELAEEIGATAARWIHLAVDAPVARIHR